MKTKSIPIKPEKILDQEGVEFISLQFTDILGGIRSVVIPRRDFEKTIKEGCTFDGSSVGFVGVHESDLTLVPDLPTLRVFPWGARENKTARIICDVFHEDGKTPFEGDPRSVLRRTLGEMKRQIGKESEFLLAPEMEFHLLIKKEDGSFAPHDQASYYYIPPYDRGAEIRKELSHALDAMGIFCEKSNHEVPKGKHEINFQHGDALSIADVTVTYKQVVKYLAHEKGLIASFMPKPFFGTYGCGMHVHLNLFDKKNGINLFSKEGSMEFSSIGNSFIAGLLDHARGLTGITNPSVNSYKRLVPGWEAPVYIAWAKYNRSSLLRIPASSPKALRVESRSPDASCNPYLAFAVMLAAGLDGVKRKLVPPPPVEKDIYHMSTAERNTHRIASLPGTLKEALDEAEKDPLIEKTLGTNLFKKFISLKRKEWENYSTQVHPWEIETYLNV
ncbi:MAG: type I glutamate--ammonia ligase [Syntrophaceae bacterium]|nr:type I glutamate--ammonia ligase [Syntrophaceae bacterium]